MPQELEFVERAVRRAAQEAGHTQGDDSDSRLLDTIDAYSVALADASGVPHEEVQKLRRLLAQRVGGKKVVH